MACNCKHNQEAIDAFYKMIQGFREMFIKRMTVDSETKDRRRKDYNQAIFHYLYGDENAEKPQTYSVVGYIDMNIILECFDNAVKDYRRSFCDVDGCNRK